jgi:serine/threonine protein kinase
MTNKTFRRENGDFRLSILSECSNLIRSMLRVDRASRATLADVMLSSWMTIPIITHSEEADDDLDSTWSIISRNERPDEVEGSVSATPACGADCRYLEGLYQYCDTPPLWKIT